MMLKMEQSRRKSYASVEKPIIHLITLSRLAVDDRRTNFTTITYFPLSYSKGNSTSREQF